MTEELSYIIFFGSLFYLAIFVGASIFFGAGDHCFNLKTNYKNWHKLNWVGVCFFTILYWVAFLPFTLIAFIYWIFTVGRK